MNISGVKFEEHCFPISRDILYSVNCEPHDVITYLICVMQKPQYLSNEKTYSKKENTILIFFEKVFNNQQLFFISWAL